MAGDDEVAPVLREKRVEVITAVEQPSTTATAVGALITLEVNERPLQQVLDYLRAVSGKNISVIKEKDKRLLVTFKLENVTYRAILDFIARKYGMTVDESRIKDNLIFLDTPEKVSMVFQRADIRDVINTIAIQSNANIVIGPEISGELSMRLENVPWNDALNIVVRTLDFVAVQEANNTIRITSPAKIEKQLDIRIFRLAYVSPEGSKYTAVLQSEFTKREESKETAQAGTSLIDVLTKVKSPQGTISFEKRSNSLVVRDMSTVLDQMQVIINKLDQSPKQVHISVKLVELSDADTEAIGVNWNQGIQFAMSPLSSWSTAFPFDVSNGLSRSWLGDLAIAAGPTNQLAQGALTKVFDVFTMRNAANRGGNTLFNRAGGTLDASFNPGITFGSMGFGATTALLQLLRTKTAGRVIQSPQLIALDNEEATIQVGELVRYAESFFASTEGGGQVSGYREASGSPLKLGMQLLIIPHVTGPENNVLMTIIPKTEDFSLNRGGGGAPEGFQRFVGPNGINLDLPQTNQRIVVTKMMLRNGETGVIGGLRSEREDMAETKVPVFSEIPFIGRLFKNRTRSISARNLLVFVTPTIIDFHEENQFRKELDKIRTEFSGPLTIIGEEIESNAK
ncbi:MAG: secretin N-terminal domain-containing protein [Planctomycetota bacterium]